MRRGAHGLRRAHRAVRLVGGPDRRGGARVAQVPAPRRRDRSRPRRAPSGPRPSRSGCRRRSPWRTSSGCWTRPAWATVPCRCATGRSSSSSTARARASRRRWVSTSTTWTAPRAGDRPAVRQGQQGARGAAGRVRARGRGGLPRPGAARAGRRERGRVAGGVPQHAWRAAQPAERVGGAAGGRGDGPGWRRPSTSPRTPCGTRSPRTCSPGAPTSGWSRSCSGTRR